MAQTRLSQERLDHTARLHRDTSQQLWDTRSELRELQQQHVALTTERDALLADRDRLRERGLVLATEHGAPERWEAAVQNHPDPYEILWHEGPFTGFTVAKGRVLQDALCGHEVLVQGRFGEDRGIFIRIVLPGGYSRLPYPLGWCYDLEIATNWRGRKCSEGSVRHLGIGAVKRFEVIGPEYGFCGDCYAWVPKEDLIDLSDSGWPDRPLCCRKTDDWGACL